MRVSSCSPSSFISGKENLKFLLNSGIRPEPEHLYLLMIKKTDQVAAVIVVTPVLRYLFSDAGPFERNNELIPYFGISSAGHHDYPVARKTDSSTSWVMAMVVSFSFCRLSGNTS